MTGLSGATNCVANGGVLGVDSQPAIASPAIARESLVIQRIDL